MVLFYNGKRFVEYEFEKEADFEKEISENFKLFFGQDSIFIDAKKKIETKSLGNSIPDGFLFDLSDKDNPEFYLVEVELAKHDFFNHIFPQITKFFGFFKNTTPMPSASWPHRPINPRTSCATCQNSSSKSRSCGKHC